MNKIKMWKIIGFTGIAIIILIVLASLSLIASSGSSLSSIETASISKNGLTPHDPIYIDGNSDFTEANGVTDGNGTENNPYIIEGWDINASQATGEYLPLAGIKIKSTNAYFIIRNCSIHDGGSDYHGIYFYNVDRGSIHNTTIYNNNYGIYLFASSIYSPNNISTNYIYNNSGIGILLSGSNNNVDDNYVYNNHNDGICIGYHSSNNNLNANHIYNNHNNGIYIGSSNNVLRNNTLDNNTYSLGIEGECASEFYQDIDTSNTINGKPIYYITDQNNLIFDNTINVGYLGLLSCNNITVENLDIYGVLLVNTTYSILSNITSHNSSVGIYFYTSSNNSLSNSHVYNNSNEGFRLHYSTGNSIINCIVYNNSDGVCMSYSSNNNISNCNVYNNSDDGIYLYSSSNNTIGACSIYNNDCGIFLLSSKYNQVIGCHVYDNFRGLVIMVSNNIIANCSFHNIWENIHLSFSHNNQIMRCTSYGPCYGIWTYYSSNNSIINCVFYNHTYGTDIDHSNNNQIENCVYYSSSQAIFIRDSSENNNVTNSTFYSCSSAIKISYTSHAAVVNSTIFSSGEGIMIDHSPNSEIVNCTLHNNSGNAIYLRYSPNCVLKNNILENNEYGFDIKGEDISDFHQDIGTSNTIDGKPVYYISNEHNRLFNETISIGFLWLVSCSNISAENFDIYGVAFMNTSLSTISNCTIHNSFAGVSFEANSNNNSIMFCRVYDNFQGIYSDSCSFNTIINCTFYNNSYGTYLSSSSNNAIINCSCYNNYWGIYLYSSSNNNLITCNIYNNLYGIDLIYSPNSTLRDSVLENNTCNFNIEGWDVSDYYQDIDISNTVDGKQIYYVVEKNNLIFDETLSIGYLGLISCTNITIKNLELKDNGQGILLANATCSTINTCTIYNNSLGIYFDCFSNNNSISACNIYNNYRGIYFDYFSDNNLISACSIHNNYGDGIYLDLSSNNRIRYCNIYDNTIVDYGIPHYGVYSLCTVNATHNWWGSADGPSGAASGSGDPVNSAVIYDPWFVEELEDLTPPIITQVTPSNGVVDISINTTITITFSEPMNILTIPGNIAVEPNIGIDYVWSNNNATPSIVPNTHLSYNTTYTFTISTNVEDDAKATDSKGVTQFVGNHLLYPYQFSFTTEKDITPPIANAGLDKEINEDVEIELNASLSWDDAGIINWTWSFMDQGEKVFLYDEFVYYTFTQPGYYITTLNISDAAGNWDIDVVNITVKDVTPPIITIISPENISLENNTITNQNITLVYFVSDNFDDTGNITVIGPDNNTLYSGEEEHTVTINASDRAGNTVNKTIYFVIDKTNPNITITGVMDGIYYNVSVTPMFWCSDINLDTVSATLNDEIFINGTVVEDEGGYTLVVQATDKAGNIATISISFTIDKTKPNITITGVTDGVYYNINVTSVIKFNDTNLNVTTITLNEISFESSTTITEDGEYALIAYATDKAGNTIQQTISFTIDKIKPIINIIGVADGSYYNIDITPVIDISDANLNITSITLNNNSFTSSTTISVENTYTLVVQANDMAGNIAEKTIIFAIDKTKPTILDLIPTTGTKTTKSAITVSGKTEPDATVKINGIGVPVLADGSFSKEITLSKGENTITITTTDLAGNTNTQTIIITKEVKKEQKGFIPGFEVEMLLFTLLCACLLIKKKRR